VTEGVAETERARAIGAWTGFLMLGFSIGPLIGGFLTHYGGWRSTFGFNVLIMIVSGLALWQHSRPARQSGYRLDWLGIGLLGLFMPMLISALQALPAAGASPRPALVLMTLASLSFAALLWVETRNARPLLDFGLFTNHNFRLASLLAFLLMFEIMTLLLYYNLFAQAPDGLGMSAITVGFSLVPLSVALFSFARMTPRITAALGMHKTMVGGSLLLAIGCTLAWASLAGFGFPALMLGLCLAGAGIALPYASAPRLGLAALPAAQAGNGSGVINACSFLGGTVGVTCGGIAFRHSGFSAVLVLLTVLALLGAGLSLRLRSS
jgi:MFS family permease